MAFAVVGEGQTAGDFAVLAANAVKPDKLKIIALNNVAASTTILITDNACITSSSSLRNTEGYIIWTSPSYNLSPGTVITFTSTTTTGSSNWTTSNSSVDIGTYTLGGSFAIATADDNIFILKRSSYSTSPALSEFLWGYNTDVWGYNSSTPSNTSDLPSTLTNFNTAFLLFQFTMPTLQMAVHLKHQYPSAIQANVQ